MGPHVRAAICAYMFLLIPHFVCTYVRHAGLSILHALIHVFMDSQASRQQYEDKVLQHVQKSVSTTQ